MPFAKIVDKEKFNRTNLNSYPDLIVFDAMTYVNEAFKRGIPFTQAMPSVAVSALHQKLALQNVDLIVAFIDTIIDPMLPIADQKGIPVLGLFCEIQNNPKNFKNIQYFSTKESDIFEPMGRFLKQKASKIAVLYTADTYGDSGFKTLKNEYLDNEHKIVFSDSYALQDFNVRELVQKTLSYKPDAVAVIGYGAGYENIFRVLKQYEFDGLIVSDTVAARLDTYNRLDGASRFMSANASQIHFPNLHNLLFEVPLIFFFMVRYCLKNFSQCVADIE